MIPEHIGADQRGVEMDSFELSIAFAVPRPRNCR